jgi:hypothetical protein
MAKSGGESGENNEKSAAKIAKVMRRNVAAKKSGGRNQAAAENGGAAYGESGIGGSQRAMASGGGMRQHHRLAPRNACVLAHGARRVGWRHNRKLSVMAFENQPSAIIAGENDGESGGIIRKRKAKKRGESGWR